MKQFIKRNKADNTTSLDRAFLMGVLAENKAMAITTFQKQVL